MSVFRVLEWVLEIDKAATEAAYAKLPVISGDDGCPCLSCKNFVEAVPLLPNAFASICSTLGINPTRAGEVYTFCQNDDGSHHYGGFFHFAGKILEGPRSWGSAQELDEGFSIEFHDELRLVPDNFPTPVTQMQFYGNIAWVIDEALDEPPCEG